MRIISITLLTVFLAISGFSQMSLKVGSAAPSFTGSSLDGKFYDLTQMRGSVVVVTFWSTRCEICRSELPKLSGFTSRYDSKSVVFLALTTENQAKVSGYVKGNPYRFHILTDSFGALLQYADRDRQGNIDMGYPAYFLIDQAGSVAYRGSGWDKTGVLATQIDLLLTAKQ